MRISDWSSDVCSSDLIMGDPLDLVALPNKGACLSDDHAEHFDGGGIFVDRQRHRRAGRLVNVVDHPGLGNLATDQRPDLFGEILAPDRGDAARSRRSEEHTSELQSLMRISYAVFCLKKKNNNIRETTHTKTEH